MSDKVEIEPLESTEIAEDGSPLGTLVVGGRTYRRQDTVVALGETARVELERSKSIDITGDDDADEELVSLYEGYDDNEKRKQALVRYVKDGLTASEVARELKVPEQTVLMWAYHGKWNRAAMRELSVRMEEEGRALTNLRLRNREALLRQQIEDSKKLQQKVMEKLDANSVSIKSAADALAAVSKIQNAAMGVTDSGAIVGVEGDSDRKKETNVKVALVTVYNNGSASGIPTVVKSKGPLDV